MEKNTGPLFWVGSELGSLKSVSFLSNVAENHTDLAELDRRKAPSKLCWGDDDEKSLLIGTKNGIVRTFNMEGKTLRNEIYECGNSQVSGLCCYSDRIIACTENGNLKVFKQCELLCEKSVGDDIQIMMQNELCKNFIATGGKENNLKVYDIDDLEKPVFAAKNLRNDKLDLRQPVWVTGIGFLGGEDKNSRIVVGTGDHKIKIYDPRKQRRPVLDVEWHEYPLTCISVTNNNNIVIVGNTAGYMASIDLRTGQQVGSFKGIAGSIRSIQCHKTQNFVASCGLDRFLRVFDTENRELKKKFYLKSKLNCVLLSNVDYVMEIPSSDDTDGDVCLKRVSEKKSDDEDDADIWGEMEVTEDRKLKRNEKSEKADVDLKKKKKKARIEIS